MRRVTSAERPGKSRAGGEAGGDAAAAAGSAGAAAPLDEVPGGASASAGTVASAGFAEAPASAGSAGASASAGAPAPLDDERLARELIEQVEGRATITDDEAEEIRCLGFESRFRPVVAIGVVAALAAAFLLSFGVGRYSMNPLDVVDTVFRTIIGDYANIDVNMWRTVFLIRLPRIAVVMLVGAGLALAGASYQGMFKNPLTSPDLLGASTGASVGAAFALLLSLGNTSVQLFAFVGGLLAVGMAVWLARFVRYDAMLALVLAGILVSTLFEAVMSGIKLFADGDDKLPEITYWLMGSFARVDASDVLPFAVPMAAGMALLLLNAWKLNALSFGDEEARALGVNTGATRLLVILGATLATSVSVAIAGVVGWVGLVVPHLARALVGPNYKVLLPTSMAVGAVFLLLVDNVSRLTLSVEIPIGILTAVLGVPFFVFIFRKNMRGW